MPRSMANMAKLSKAQLEFILSVYHNGGKRLANETYKPAVKLVDMNLLTMTENQMSSPTFALTDAGREWCEAYLSHWK